MTIRVEVKSIQQAVNKAGAALSTRLGEICSGKTREENQHIIKTVLPQWWRSEYRVDLILEQYPIHSLGVFAKYVDFESEEDYAWFILRWS